MDNAMWLTSGAFLSRVSDSRYGGMYMTLFNAMIHIAVRWPLSLSLWLIEPLTIRTCTEDNLRVSIRLFTNNRLLTRQYIVIIFIHYTTHSYTNIFRVLPFCEDEQSVGVRPQW